MIRRMHIRFFSFLNLLTIILLVGCAGTPQAPRAPTKAVFYPPQPDLPRIQFLKSYSGEIDLDPGEKSKFAEFVLGKETKQKPSLNKPYGVALRDDKLYVVDTRGNGYVIFDLISKQFRLINGLQKPINITIDEEGNKYVTDTMLDQIAVYDRNDERIMTYGGNNEYKPSDVAVLGDKLFVADVQNNQIQVLNKATGQKIYAIADSGSDKDRLYHPTNLAIEGNGNILVSDTSNFRVAEFTQDGRYIRQLGEIGTSFGKFARPKGIAVDHEGRIYVVDAAFQNVQVFDTEGNLLMYFGGSGVGPGQLYLPTDIYIDYTSVAYFQQYAEPGFELEYIILIANQFGPNKVNVYGFGKMRDMMYP